VPLTENQTEENQQAAAGEYKPLLLRFLARLCVAVTLGVMLLVGVELFSYFRYRRVVHEDLEPAARLDADDNETPAERQYWREFDQSNKVTYHQYVLWRRLPYAGQTISINADGVRRTLHTQCDDKTFTIWMFGDSVMWGSGTTDEDTIPSLVAQLYEQAGHPVCIVNYGEKGWSNSQELIAVLEELKHATHKPDLVFFYDGGTEAFTAYQNRRPDVHSNFNAFRNFLDNWSNTQKAGFAYLRQTNTFRLLDRVAVKAPLQGPRDQGTKRAGLDSATLSAEVIENYLENMEIVRLLGKQYGFRAVFAWYPNLAVGHKEQTSYEQQVLALEYQKFPNLGDMYRAVYERGREIHRPDFYDLENVADDHKETLYRGISHMRPEGNRVVAQQIFNILQKPPASAAPEPVHSNAPMK
jgi:hypothetical protein